MTHEKTDIEFDNIGQFTVTPEDLPLSCPLPNQAVWNAHPRVYLPIVETGKAVCPYCSAKYVLQVPAKDREDISDYSDASSSLESTNSLEPTPASTVSSPIKNPNVSKSSSKSLRQTKS